MGNLLEIYSGQEEVARAIREAARAEHASEIMATLKRLAPVAGALLRPWFRRNPSPEAEAIFKEKREHLRVDVGGGYAKLWAEPLALAALGDEGVVAWAADHVRKGKKDACCGLPFYVLAWSPLPQADRFAREIIRSNNQDDLWRLVGGYDDTPQPMPWERIEEIIRLPVRRDSVNRDLIELLKSRARDGHEKAKELLSVLGDV